MTNEEDAQDVLDCFHEGEKQGYNKALEDLKEQLQKYSGDKGDEYFAQRDFDFICKLIKEIKGEGE